MTSFSCEHFQEELGHSSCPLGRDSRSNPSQQCPYSLPLTQSKAEDSTENKMFPSLPPQYGDSNEPGTRKCHAGKKVRDPLKALWHRSLYLRQC